MHKRIPLLIGLVFVCTLSFAQILKPAKIFTETPDGPVKVGDEIELVFKAVIDKGWYIYSVGFDENCGPLPMSITLEKNGSFELVGGLIAVNDKAKHDKIFDCDVRYFEIDGEFRQKIRVLGTDLKLAGSYEGQVCSDVCVLFDGDFSFGPIAVTPGAGKPKPKTADEGNKEEKKNDARPASPLQDTTTSAAESTLAVPSKECKGPVLDPSLVKEDATSFLGFFLLSFLAGLAALLTPCVFPMIPMTVSYFTGPGRTRLHALVYGISIIVIYTLIGAAVAPLMGPETANHLSTEWIPNVIFFIVFIVFGVSFLGLFDITLPGTFITKVDQQAEKGGLFGV
ncbi:MAG TPA: cytochrome c biogenesis protein CcdA, partial [Ohtaekwangia sp.]|nr:cytochrome c biogenesis protein CcdA [Ohtaekwangia sp.]